VVGAATEGKFLGTIGHWLWTLFKLALVLALVAVIALGAILAWVTVRGFPQRDGTAQLTGLSADVKVVRDQNDIVNIYASTPEDLFAAQGWVHASERMWQMEVWRHIGAGRLAELFGPSQLETDEFVRTLGWRPAAERDLAALSPDTRTILDAYSSGVSAWLESHPDLPLPYVVTGLLGAGGGLSGFKPEPWTAVDTLSWQKVQAWSLGANWDSELFRLIAKGRGLNDEQLAELFPAYADDKPTVVPGSAHGAGLPSPVAASSEAASSAGLGRLLAVGDNLAASVGLASGGSNAFAISADKSATGHALLANDPHLGISMPSLWFLAGLHCRPVGDACPYDMAGAGFPGVPGIILGHNNRIAWGLTNVGPDVQDVFEETLDPATADHYMYKGESRAMTVRTETIKVKGDDAVELRIRETVHGPLISDASKDLRPKEDGGRELGAAGKAYALEWTAINQPDLTVQAVLGVSRARNWDEFREALQDFGAPSQTYLYADVDGNIGVQVPGKIPIRAQGDGLAPVPGESGDYDWTGYVPFDGLPFAYNPKGGLLEASNNLPSRQGPYLGAEFDPGYRAERVTGLLKDADSIDTELLRSIQKDVVLTRAAPIIAAIGGMQPTTSDGQQVLAKIKAWADDPQCTIASAGCAAFETFEYRLERATFDDELGAGDEPDDVAVRWVGTEVAHEALIRLVANPADDWFDDVTTANTKETLDELAVAALDAAGADLRSTIGDPDKWSWGAIHTVTFKEQTLGASGVVPIEMVFNKGPYPAPGSCTTINKICGEIALEYPPAGEPADLEKVFAASSSPSYRLVIDMGDMDGATIIQTTGQSGLPFDGHYDDFIGPWLDNLPVHLLWSDQAIDGAVRQTLTLKP
jgi:penicillin amidase